MLTPPSGGKAWFTMYSGQVVFAQLMELLPRHEFDTCVRRYNGEYGVRGFSCRDQFLCMAYAQLTYRESLRDIETCLRSHQPKLYHAGFPWSDRQEHARRRQSCARLANLSRFRSGADRSCSGPLCRRRLRLGLGADRLRTRLDDHRPLPDVVPLGTIPPVTRRPSSSIR